MNSDPDSIVINCPVCLRTIWQNQVCYHGHCPEPKATTEAEAQEQDTKPTRRTKRTPRADTSAS